MRGNSGCDFADRHIKRLHRASAWKLRAALGRELVFNVNRRYASRFKRLYCAAHTDYAAAMAGESVIPSSG